MKILCTMLFSLCFLCNSSYSQEWIPFQGHINNTVQYYPIYNHPQPTQQMIIYQLTPVIVYENIITDQHCLFRRTQTIVSQPVIRWVYYPTIVYK